MATPQYDYNKAVNELDFQKRNDDLVGNYARFISQRRYNRGQSDAMQNFRRSVPQFNAQYARRGMFDSGIRRGGFGQYASDFAQQQERAAEDQTAYESQWEQEKASRGAGYQRALMDLFEQMQVGRTADDPFAAYRGLVAG